MTKLVFHLFFLGITTLAIARPSHAQLFNTVNGLIGPKTELYVKAGIESNDQVALASFCESAPDCDSRGLRLGNGNSCGKGSGKSCGNGVGSKYILSKTIRSLTASASVGDFIIS